MSLEELQVLPDELQQVLFLCIVGDKSDHLRKVLDWRGTLNIVYERTELYPRRSLSGNRDRVEFAKVFGSQLELHRIEKFTDPFFADRLFGAK